MGCCNSQSSEGLKEVVISEHVTVFAPRENERFVNEIQRKYGGKTSENSGRSILHIAVLEQNGTQVKQLLDEEKYTHIINDKDATKHQYAPIHYACVAISEQAETDSNINSNLAIFKMLVEHKCDVNITDDSGNLPIHLVCSSNNSVILQYMIESSLYDNIKLNQLSRLYKETPLMTAIMKRSIECVRVLCQMATDKIDLLTIETVYETSKYVSLELGAVDGDNQILQLLVQCTLEVIEKSRTKTNSNQLQVLILALLKHLQHIVQHLQKLLEVDDPTNVCQREYGKCIQVLDEFINQNKSTYTDINNETGWTMLHQEAKHNFMENDETGIVKAILKLVLNDNSDGMTKYNVFNLDGLLPIHIAAENNNNYFLNFILNDLKYNDNINQVTFNQNGETPLMIAIRCDNISCVKSLCNSGYNLDILDIKHKLNKLNCLEYSVYFAQKNNGDTRVFKILLVKVLQQLNPSHKSIQSIDMRQNEIDLLSLKNSIKGCAIDMKLITSLIDLASGELGDNGVSNIWKLLNDLKLILEANNVSNDHDRHLEDRLKNQEMVNIKIDEFDLKCDKGHKIINDSNDEKKSQSKQNENEREFENDDLIRKCSLCSGKIIDKEAVVCQLCDKVICFSCAAALSLVNMLIENPIQNDQFCQLMSKYKNNGAIVKRVESLYFICGVG